MGEQQRARLSRETDRDEKHAPALSTSTNTGNPTTLQLWEKTKDSVESHASDYKILLNLIFSTVKLFINCIFEPKILTCSTF